MTTLDNLIIHRFPYSRQYEYYIHKRLKEGKPINMWRLRLHDLSESFIREFKDELHWSSIIGTQKNLSKDFLREFKEEVFQEADWELEAPGYDEQFLDAVEELYKDL